MLCLACKLQRGSGDCHISSNRRFGRRLVSTPSSGCCPAATAAAATAAAAAAAASAASAATSSGALNKLGTAAASPSPSSPPIGRIWSASMRTYSSSTKLASSSAPSPPLSVNRVLIHAGMQAAPHLAPAIEPAIAAVVSASPPPSIAAQMHSSGSSGCRRNDEIAQQTAWTAHGEITSPLDQVSSRQRTPHSTISARPSSGGNSRLFGSATARASATVPWMIPATFATALQNTARSMVAVAVVAARRVATTRAAAAAFVSSRA